MIPHMDGRQHTSIKPGAVGRLAHLRTGGLRRTLVRIVIGLVVMAGAAALLGWWLSRQNPGWWRTVDAQAPRTQEVAQAVERGVTTLVHDKQPGATSAERQAPWEMSIDQESASAWLCARLPRWVVNQGFTDRWPDQIGQLQVAFDPGKIHVAAEIGPPEARRIYAATLAPHLNAQGELWLTATSFAVGRMPAPVSWVLGEAAARLPSDDGARLVRILEGAEPLADRAEFRLADRRTVRIVGVEVQAGKLILRCRTEEAE